jgi:hypothetical protein
MSGARSLGFAVLAFLVVGCPSEKGSSTTVLFRVQPVGATSVTLWDAEKAFEVRAGASETVELAAPLDRLHAPRVTIEAADGSETTSAKLSVSPVTSVVEVGRLRIWPAKVLVQRDGERIRFSWPALEGTDVPEALRYSLLFVYKNAQGNEAEGTLITKGEREAIQTLPELSEIFPERDPKVRVMTLRIRAYGGSPTEGATWAGPKQDWPVPDELPLPQGGR